MKHAYIQTLRQHLHHANLGLVLLAALTGNAQAGGGTPPPTPGGVLDLVVQTNFITDPTLPFPFDAGSSDVANAIATQSDGKVVLAGTVHLPDESRFGLARYNSDGSLDLSFGSAGKVVTDFSRGSDEIDAIVIQSDGKIIVAGSTRPLYAQFEDHDLAVARYNPNGTLDTSFANGGKFTYAFGIYSDGASALAIQSDGKIVVGGSTQVQRWDGTASTANQHDFALLRLNPNGSLDNSFGNSGQVTTPLSSYGIFRQSGIRALLIQGDGKLVAAGSNGEFALARYNTNGSLDSTFGSGGTVTRRVTTSSAFQSSSGATALALQQDGKILAGGYILVHGAYKPSSDVFTPLLRFNPNGSLDTRFGRQGQIAGAQVGVPYIRGAHVQADGKIVVAGEAQIGRYTANGTLDNNFDADGVLNSALGIILASTLQSNGKILVAGQSNDIHTFTTTDFMWARYLP